MEIIITLSMTSALRRRPIIMDIMTTKMDAIIMACMVRARTVFLLRTRAAGISLCAGHGGIAASIHFCIGKMKHGAYPFAVLSKLMVLL